MKQRSRQWWIFALVGGAIALLLLLNPVHVAAQSLGGLESRVARLEAENSVLRSRVGQLESQLGRVGSGAGRSPNVPTSPPRSLPGDSALAENPTFRRLATLVIELRERIGELENQVKVLQENRR